MKDEQRSRLLKARASDLLTLLLLFIILNAASLHARSGTREHAVSFASQQEQAASGNPAGVSFTIRLKDGRKQFEPGEIINLEMLFSSRTPNTYSLNNASYDRSGRLLIDTYHVDPQEGVSDPLDDYFDTGLFGFMGGGPFSSSWLDVKPALIASELNDWYRFDRPGKYRLYVTSKRVGRKRDADDDAYHTQEMTLTSNIIEFEILPGDAKWAGQKLREAVAILDAQEQGVNKRAACHTLRFLGTTGAAREMARRLRGVDQECDSEYVFGLMGSPHRALVISEMERLLEAPEHPVSYSFLRTLSFLSFTAQHPASLPPYPDAKDQQQRALWQKLFNERMEKYEQVMNDYVRRLTAAVNGKRGRAQAISFHTIVEISASLPQEKRSAELSAERERIAGALPSIFNELPPDTQFSMLDSYWDQISGPAMLPVLRRLYLRPPETTWEVRDRALQRIYDLAPAEGRALILLEARSLHPRVGMEVLGLLPERTLPELDEALADNLEGEFDEIHSALVERYASPAIAARVRAAYGDKGGKMACAIQAPLLAYFLRVDPPQGEALVRQALAARGPKDTGCYDMLLDDVSRLYTSPELERIAIETLSDANIEMVAHAATLLGQYGTATAEEPLWQRFEKWHAEWQEREADLSGKLPGRTSLGASALADQAFVESALRGALIHSGAWLADAEQLKRIRALCLTEKGRLETEEWTKKWNGPITITLGSVDGIPQSFYVVQYSLSTFTALKDKLAQFPQGTSFNWKPDSEGLKERQLFNELKDYLEGRGMKLQR